MSTALNVQIHDEGGVAESAFMLMEFCQQACSHFWKHGKMSTVKVSLQHPVCMFLYQASAGVCKPVLTQDSLEDAQISIRNKAQSITLREVQCK